MDFQLQPAADDDHSFLAELYSDVRAPEFLAAGLPTAMLEPLLTMQHSAQVAGYAQQYPAAVDAIVWIKGERAGRLLVNTTAAEIRLVDVALLTRFRGQSVGSQLIRAVRERARAAGLPLRLSVHAGNPAQRLYERLGFVITSDDGVNRAMELR